MAGALPDVDLRSDTVTQPTPAMRAAMAAAEVGDDVYGEDPTVRALEERVADLLGHEAALWVPTGTMANQVALAAQVRPGDCMLIGRDAHCWLFECGALAALAGAQTQALPGDGRFTAADVRAAYRPIDPYGTPTTVVALEDTHNFGGGLVWSADAMTEVVAAARELGLAVHLDGARLWNAAVAGGRSERAIAAGFDSVAVCLSKGLGAPAGSVVAGSRDLVRRCHRLSKMYGGGMRQAGVLSAAGLNALDHHRERLLDDHRHARRLADALAGAAGLKVDPAAVQTNIVVVEVTSGDAPGLVAAARGRGVRLGALDRRRIRAVTHLDVDGAGVDRAAAVLRELAAAMPT
ncbi:MAG: GntG family PLP-dependent aldolase [Kofleriaceae bacterium]